MRLSEWLCWEFPAGQVDNHHDEIKADIPELGAMVLTGLEEPVQFDTLVTAFRRSPLVIH